MLGLFPLISMFLVTSITMLRERTTGHARAAADDAARRSSTCCSATALAFAAVAVVQATVVSIVGFGLLGLDTVHSTLLIVLLAVANALLGMAFGLFVSAFAQTEFQAVQFMPAFVLPQILLCGLFVARDQMADWLQWLSAAAPADLCVRRTRRAAHEPTSGRASGPMSGSWSGRRCSPSCSEPRRCAGGRRSVDHLSVQPFAPGVARVPLRVVGLGVERRVEAAVDLAAEAAARARRRTAPDPRAPSGRTPSSSA